MPDKVFPKRVVVVAGVFRDAARRRELGKMWGMKFRDHFSDADIRVMYDTTKQLIASGRLVNRAKIGHCDMDQRLKGYAKSMVLTRVTGKDGKSRLGIAVEPLIKEPFADDYAANLYPDTSIEFEEDGLDENGKKIPLHMTAWALLGTDPPAVGHMPSQLATVDGLQLLITDDPMKKKGLLSRLFGAGKANHLAEVDNSMAEEWMQAIAIAKSSAENLPDSDDKNAILENLEIVMKGLEELRVTMEGETEEEVVEEEIALSRAGKEGEDMKGKELAALINGAVAQAVKPLQAELAGFKKEVDNAKAAEAKEAERLAKQSTDDKFNELVKDGHCVAEDKKMFLAGVKSEGVEHAVNYFKGLSRKTPANTVDPIIQTSLADGDPELAKQHLSLVAKYKADFNYSEADAKLAADAAIGSLKALRAGAA